MNDFQKDYSVGDREEQEFQKTVQETFDINEVDVAIGQNGKTGNYIV